ncbi:MAG: caspase family protein, partial [Deltaproteobacteria bacterium]|nr:caspase family protein [Deltaproteobacteria bacterium]
MNMLKRSHSFHLLVVAVIASVFLVSSNKSDAKQQTWGLCIGVSDYEDDDIPDLKWASKDAIEFCTTFLKHRLKLPEEHYQILFESSAKKQEIEKLLGWLSIKAKAEDQVFIFYSGHGGKTSPIVPYDANPNDKQTFLGSDIIQKALDKIDAHETIFIIDACYSGRLA